jgi:ribonuclease PH
MCDEVALLDLDYEEDKKATVDLNLVATEDDALVEVQGAGEEATFSHGQLLEMLSLGRKGIADLVAAQHRVLEQSVAAARPLQ